MPIPIRRCDLTYDSGGFIVIRRMDEKSKTPFGAYLILIVFDHRHLSESGKTVTLAGPSPQMKGPVDYLRFFFNIN